MEADKKSGNHFAGGIFNLFSCVVGSDETDKSLIEPMVA